MMFKNKNIFSLDTTKRRNFFFQYILCIVIFNFLHFNTLSLNFPYTAVGSWNEAGKKRKSQNLEVLLFNWKFPEHKIVSIFLIDDSAKLRHKHKLIKVLTLYIYCTQMWWKKEKESEEIS